MNLPNQKILLTGFEPFGEFKINSSWEAVQLIAKENNPQIHCECLPVDYHTARVRLLDLLKSYQPTTCLCTGLAAGEQFRLERIARKPDQFEDLEGPARLTGQWQWDKVMKAFQLKELPAYFSDDAGQYVCESTYWTLLNFNYRSGFPINTAFLHVPPLSKDWSTEKIATGIATMLEI